MRRFKNILLIYECDHSTLERISTIAKRNGAALTLIHVISKIPASWNQLYVDFDTNEGLLLSELALAG